MGMYQTEICKSLFICRDSSVRMRIFSPKAELFEIKILLSLTLEYLERININIRPRPSTVHVENEGYG